MKQKLILLQYTPINTILFIQKLQIPLVSILPSSFAGLFSWLLQLLLSKDTEKRIIEMIILSGSEFISDAYFCSTYYFILPFHFC